MVTTFYPPYHFGGDATYVRALSRELVIRGHEVEVVHCEDAFDAVKQSQPSSGKAEQDGVIVHRLKSLFGVLSPLFTQQTGHPGFKYSALKEILSRDFDVVNFHNVSLIGGPAVFKLSKAAVNLYTLHEHWLLCPTHIFWKNKALACDRPQCLSCSLRSGIPPQLWRHFGLIRRSVAKLDCLLAPSKFTALKHREAGFDTDIRVLPLFSTLDPGDPADFVPPARPRYVYVGRVTASKGVEPMLSTFSRLDDVDLQVIGDGDLLNSLRADYARCTNISFLGKVKQAELVELYQNATALVLPSLAPETFGLSVAEAFACATPAIVRDSGGSRELIDATGAGFSYRSEEELEQIVKRLATDKFLRISLGKKALEGFRSKYTAAHHLDGYLARIAEIQQQKGVTVHSS